uniref:Beta-galactosidase n=1 Tax=Rhizobium meliloti TaxID=382 RepID=BGAL_RHIML|nr:RecName: Full=Beta-galactosidase; Short=Beta-gal; AltName: Full=Lactase [Sinorhizobium meliloti]AAA26296.1 beta-galactosidase [Sinorhizobium meliloti]
MRSVTSFNDSWVFSEASTRDAERSGRVSRSACRTNAVELPFNYFDERCYQRAFTYQRVLAWRPDFSQGSRSSSTRQWPMRSCISTAKRSSRIRDGYTPFEARLTDRLLEGDNLITVKIDGSENPEIPPFGAGIDYLTYAGIYRDVWLKVTDPVSIANIKIETRDVLSDHKAVSLRCDLSNPQGLSFSGTISALLKNAAGEVLAEVAGETTGQSLAFEMDGLRGLSLWDIDDPVLYVIEVELRTGQGFRLLRRAFRLPHGEFTTEGFRLNGRPLKIRGLNRHQSFPYVGLRMGRTAKGSAHADIMNAHRLHCNLVRTSHYPQSKWFLDHCDRIGLLVFARNPRLAAYRWGGMETGGNPERPPHRSSATGTTRLSYIWGVRINESQDSHDFYAETNRLARELDPTRQTGGVRYITDSEFLEDVYTMNDFILGNEELPGANRPGTALRPQQECTGLPRKVPYLITEFGGHMYPTKIYDQEQRQAEHVRRHLEVLNAAYARNPGISGAIGWCMFDYNTTRISAPATGSAITASWTCSASPKFAAYVYASQCDPSEEIVMKPVTFWARGDDDIGGVLPLIVLTNCDEIELKYGSLTKRVGPDRENFPHLPHPPVVIDHRHFTKDELGVWGMKWESAEFTGFIAGKPVADLRMAADPVPTTLQVEADSKTLRREGRDTVRLILRALDQAGNVLPFLNDAVDIEIHGPARLVGPARIVLQGGSGFLAGVHGRRRHASSRSRRRGSAAAKLDLVALADGAASA